MEVSVGEFVVVGDSVITILQASEQEGQVRLGLTVPSETSTNPGRCIGGDGPASHPKQSAALTILENIRGLCSMLRTYVGCWVASRSTARAGRANKERNELQRTAIRTFADVSEVQKD